MVLNNKQLKEIYLIVGEVIKEYYGKIPYNYQRRIINRILKAVFNNEGGVIIIEIARQAGKTEGVAMTAFGLKVCFFQICTAYNIPNQKFFNMGFFGPKEDQPRTDFNRLKDALKHAQDKGIKLKFDTFNGNTITVTGDGQPKRESLCLSASPTAHIESKTLHLIFLEEAQDLIDEKVKNAILPMGSHTNATVVYIGPAGYRRCLFKNMIDTLPEESKIIIPYKEIIAERRAWFEKDGNIMHLNYEKYVDKQIEKFGTDDDSFQTQYALKWILARGQFITYAELITLEEEYKTATRGVMYDHPVHVGIDWGKAHDSTIMTIVNEQCQVVAWYEWQGDDYSSQIEEITEILHSEFRVINQIFCDSTGNQDMAVDILRRKLRDCGHHDLPVNAVNFTAKSKDEMYKNLSRLMKDTRHGEEVITPARLKFPKEYNGIRKGKFIKQMVDLQKDIKNNLWRCEHPRGPEYHDDYCDSLALAVYGFTPAREDIGTVSWNVA